MRTGRDGIVRTRHFDTLIGVGQRVVDDRVDPFENEAFMRSLTVRGAKKVAHPKRDGLIVHLVEREFDEDSDHVFANLPRGGRYVDNKKRRRKEIEQEIKGMGIGPHSLWQLYLVRKEKLENLPERIERYTMKEPLGHLLLESDPNNDKNKMRAVKAREYKTSMTERSSCTWKNSGLVTASKQWARHKPKIHTLWTIGEETCATYLTWQREEEEWEREYAEMVSREMSADQEYNDNLWRTEELRFEELEARYWYGDWCVQQRESRSYNTKYDFGDLNEEAWAWNQAAA
jgi:hypothetical protein